MTQTDVRAILGDPFESTEQGSQTQWRYYERFTPRGCNPPALSQQIRVTFQDGAVVSSETVAPKKP